MGISFSKRYLIFFDFVFNSNIILGFLGVFGVLAIVWAGVQMIIHFGDEEKITKSKNIIMYVVIGLFIAAIAWTVIRFFLNPGTGV